MAQTSTSSERTGAFASGAGGFGLQGMIWAADKLQLAIPVWVASSVAVLSIALICVSAALWVRLGIKWTSAWNARRHAAPIGASRDQERDQRELSHSVTTATTRVENAEQAFRPIAEHIVATERARLAGQLLADLDAARAGQMPNEPVRFRGLGSPRFCERMKIIISEDRVEQELKKIEDEIRGDAVYASIGAGEPFASVAAKRTYHADRKKLDFLISLVRDWTPPPPSELLRHL